MPTRAELKTLSKTRLKEAKALYNCRLYDGVCYLSGYVIELALKARICKILDINDYPERGEISKSYKTHNLDDLIKLSGLSKRMAEEKTTNPTFLENWSLLTEWNESFRYNPIGTSIQQTARDTIDALDNQRDGIFTWIKRYW